MKNRFFFVQTDCPASLPQLFADAQKLSRVLTNLIENAVQHTPPGGTIIISATALPEKLQICVADSGNGIPEAAIDVIFDKFVQVKEFPECGKRQYRFGIGNCPGNCASSRRANLGGKHRRKGSKFYFTMPVNIGN
ncbi:MAG: ATP-binding protein [Calditrichia bacterium]